MSGGKKEDFKLDTITLRKKEIQVRLGFMRHAELKFYSENPRIYTSLWNESDVEPSQGQIYDALVKSDHVRETLVPSIRSNGGLIEPVLVRKNVVLEGNSRLAAYRFLAKENAATWEYIRVRVFPDDISDGEIFSLLGEYHINGKKDWQPYEQAGYLYRRFKNHGITEDQLHDEVGLTKQKVSHLIRVYQFMIDEHDRDPAHWSYYDELLKSRRMDSARKLYPKFDQVIAEKIKSSDIVRAVDVRDKLPQIVQVGGNTLKRFLNGALSFDDAVEDARQRGAGNYNARKLTDFRKWLADSSLDEEFSTATHSEQNVLRYELEKIHTRLQQLAKKIKPSS